MGLSDELTKMIGDRAPEPVERDRSAWQRLCCCGHLEKNHSESIGGTSVRPPGLPERIPYAFDGCRGEMPHPSVETRTVKPVGPEETVTVVELATCPCTEFRPVAEVDRPSRYFHQRRPANPEDHARHPFLVGLRAYRTRISKFKGVDGDPAKRDRVLDLRFRWIDGARVCSISRCTATDDVWPVFIDLSYRSELRCPKHR